MIYLLTKDSTLLAFEGRPELDYPKHFTDKHNENRRKYWEREMAHARKSALPVVDAHISVDNYPQGLLAWLDYEDGASWYIKPGETVALPGWGLEKCYQKKDEFKTNPNWIDVTESEFSYWEGVTVVGDFAEYREAYRLVRSEPVKQPIKCTFYSGKLWNSDKPVPEICHECDNIANKVYQYCEGCVIEHSKSVLDWLSTAYEVVNPEVIPNVSVAAVGLVTGDGSGWVKLSDGDQITLPEGYGIRKTRTCKWHGILNNCGNETCWDLEECQFSPEKFVATITLPEKPDNSAHGYTSEGGKIEKEYMDRMINTLIDKWNLPYKQARDVGRDLFYSFVFPVYELGGQFGCKVNRAVEPSESQQELWNAAEELAWGELSVKFLKEEGKGEIQIKARVHHVIDVLKEHFTIIRK